MMLTTTIIISQMYFCAKWLRNEVNFRFHNVEYVV